MLALHSDEDLLDLKEKLTSLEDERGILEEVDLIKCSSLEGIFGDDYGPKKSRRGSDPTVHKCQLGARNVELKDDAVGSASRGRRHAGSVVDRILSESQMNSTVMISTSTGVQRYQDCFEWTEGTSININDIIEKSNCALQSSTLQVLIEQDRSPDGHSSSGQDSRMASQVFAGVLEIESDTADTNPAIQSAVDIVNGLPQNKFELDFITPFRILAEFRETSPLDIVEKQLQESQNILSSAPVTATQLASRQRRLMEKLPNAPDNSIADMVIKTAEEQASVIETCMNVVRKERFPLLERAERDLHSAATRLEELSTPFISKLQALIGEHETAAELAATETDKIEAWLCQESLDDVTRAEATEQLLVQSTHKIEKNNEEIEEVWLRMAEDGDRLLHLHTKRLLLVAEHCNQVEQHQKLLSDANVTEVLCSNHMKTLETYQEIRHNYARTLNGILEAYSGGLTAANQIMTVCEESKESMIQSDAELFSDMHDRYCDLLTDLLSRRRNRVGQIDVEGTLLKMRQVTNSYCDMNITEESSNADIQQLRNLKDEKQKVEAYIKHWEDKLTEQSSLSKQIYERCNIADASERLFGKINLIRSDYHIRQQELLNSITDLQKESVNFIKETNTAPPIELSENEFKTQHALACGIDLSSQGIL